MNFLLRSDGAKLLLGGCGTQLGMLISCGTVAAVALVCLACGLTNLAVINLVSPAGPAAVDTAAVGGVIVVGEDGLPLNLAVSAAPPTATSIPKSNVRAIEDQVSLRSGPGVEYDVVATIALGGRLEVLGRNFDSTWWFVAIPEGGAWVSDTLVEVTLYDADIPVVAVPAQFIQPTAPSDQ